MKKYKVGFTAGVFDMFHVGHLNLIKSAKEQCDYLIVGVNSDKLVESYKNKKVIVNEKDRKSILSAIKYVDQVEIMDSLNKITAWKDLKFDVVFIGDDWKGNDRWINTETELSAVGAKVVYIPYTKNISSTILREVHELSVGET